MLTKRNAASGNEIASSSTTTKLFSIKNFSGAKQAWKVLIIVVILFLIIIIITIIISSSSSSGGSSSSSSKLLYLHGRKILQYCKSISIVISNKTRQEPI